MIEDPIEKFKIWWKDIEKNTNTKHTGAVCVSTIDNNGFPSGRFVDLKEVSKEGFTFCTHLGSPKSIDIARNEKVGLTFWWENLGYQVRVLGNAKKIPSLVADKYWNMRSRDAKIIALSCQQSQPIASIQELHKQFELKCHDIGNKKISRPDNWGGYIVKPISIEFLSFKENRLHLRELYLYIDSNWQRRLLQP
ncbi:pyridoxamine-phosphate oxidase [Photorhabdus heterorhabditis]|uniref:Pyridoxamine-phosphate oxidase n=1 Tax=Photorhabdus heterorhabditis TaxID=880156 RepID=A0ABR5KDK4_9GAMM|nr:pyridoxal 5'-phosphate synthase [Photorhabdus heterorhabditis]KOY62510.1 pyridoxamine-phosphate oxidase [Photorhabdus heterorhabditis]